MYYSFQRDLLAQVTDILTKYFDPYTGRLDSGAISNTANSKVKRLIHRNIPTGSQMSFVDIRESQWNSDSVLVFSIPTITLLPDFDELVEAGLPVGEIENELDRDEVADRVWENLPSGIEPDMLSFHNIEWQITPGTNGEKTTVEVYF